MRRCHRSSGTRGAGLTREFGIHESPTIRQRDCCRRAYRSYPTHRIAADADPLAGHAAFGSAQHRRCASPYSGLSVSNRQMPKQQEQQRCPQSPSGRKGQVRTSVIHQGEEGAGGKVVPWALDRYCTLQATRTPFTARRRGEPYDGGRADLTPHPVLCKARGFKAHSSQNRARHFRGLRSQLLEPPQEGAKSMRASPEQVDWSRGSSPPVAEGRKRRSGFVFEGCTRSTGWDRPAPRATEHRCDDSWENYIPLNRHSRNSIDHMRSPPSSGKCNLERAESCNAASNSSPDSRRQPPVHLGEALSKARPYSGSSFINDDELQPSLPSPPSSSESSCRSPPSIDDPCPQRSPFSTGAPRTTEAAQMSDNVKEKGRALLETRLSDSQIAFWKEKVRLRGDTPLGGGSMTLSSERGAENGDSTLSPTEDDGVRHVGTAPEMLVLRLSMLDLSPSSTHLSQLLDSFLPAYRSTLDMPGPLPSELFLISTQITSHAMEAILATLFRLNIHPVAMHLSKNPSFGAAELSVLSDFIRGSLQPFRWLSLSKTSLTVESMKNFFSSVLSRPDIYPRQISASSPVSHELRPNCVPLWLDVAPEDFADESDVDTAGALFAFLEDNYSPEVYCRAQNRVACGINRCSKEGAFFHLPKLASSVLRQSSGSRCAVPTLHNACAGVLTEGVDRTSFPVLDDTDLLMRPEKRVGHQGSPSVTIGVGGHCRLNSAAPPLRVQQVIPGETDTETRSIREFEEGEADDDGEADHSPDDDDGSRQVQPCAASDSQEEELGRIKQSEEDAIIDHKHSEVLDDMSSCSSSEDNCNGGVGGRLSSGMSSIDSDEGTPPPSVPNAEDGSSALQVFTAIAPPPPVAAPRISGLFQSTSSLVPGVNPNIRYPPPPPTLLFPVVPPPPPLPPPASIQLPSPSPPPSFTSLPSAAPYTSPQAGSCFPPSTVMPFFRVTTPTAVPVDVDSDTLLSTSHEDEVQGINTNDGLDVSDREEGEVPPAVTPSSHEEPSRSHSSSFRAPEAATESSVAAKKQKTQQALLVAYKNLLREAYLALARVAIDRQIFPLEFLKDVYNMFAEQKAPSAVPILWHMQEDIGKLFVASESANGSNTPASEESGRRDPSAVTSFREKSHEPLRPDHMYVLRPEEMNLTNTTPEAGHAASDSSSELERSAEEEEEEDWRFPTPLTGHASEAEAPRDFTIEKRPKASAPPRRLRKRRRVVEEVMGDDGPSNSDGDGWVGSIYRKRRRQRLTSASATAITESPTSSAPPSCPPSPQSEPPSAHSERGESAEAGSNSRVQRAMIDEAEASYEGAVPLPSVEVTRAAAHSFVSDSLPTEVFDIADDVLTEAATSSESVAVATSSVIPVKAKRTRRVLREVASQTVHQAVAPRAVHRPETPPPPVLSIPPAFPLPLLSHNRQSFPPPLLKRCDSASGHRVSIGEEEENVSSESPAEVVVDLDMEEDDQECLQSENQSLQCHERRQADSSFENRNPTTGTLSKAGWHSESRLDRHPDQDPHSSPRRAQPPVSPPLTRKSATGRRGITKNSTTSPLLNGEATNAGKVQRRVPASRMCTAKAGSAKNTKKSVALRPSARRKHKI